MQFHNPLIYQMTAHSSDAVLLQVSLPILNRVSTGTSVPHEVYALQKLILLRTRDEKLQPGELCSSARLEHNESQRFEPTLPAGDLDCDLAKLLRFLRRVLCTPVAHLPSLLPPPAAAGCSGQELPLLSMLQRVREALLELKLPGAAAAQAHVLDEAHLHRVAAQYALQVSLVTSDVVCS
jgi:hypothetical protein